MTERDDGFRRLYLEQRIRSQRRYYGARAEEYRAAHRQVVLLRIWLLFASALAGVVAQATEGTARAAWAVGAAVVSSLAGAVTAYDALIGFPLLEKLYSDAEQNLHEAAVDWDAPGADVAAEIDRVEWIFRSERGQWGQLVVKSATSTTPATQGDAGDAADGGAPDRRP